MIIGITGKKRSGKDTIGNYIVQTRGFNRYSLAQPMKEACKYIFLFDYQQLYGDKKEVIDPRYGVTPREILQVFGTELFQQDIYKHLPHLKIPERKLWINRFRLWYESIKGEDVVITDVRFPHEVEEIRKMGGIIVEVIRPSIEENDYSKHASEQEMDEIKPDYIILNDSSITNLQYKINKMFRKL